MATIDLKNGIYRRIYSGAIRGRRINQVSLEAEACFWRLHMVADDHGNLEATPDLLLAQAFTRRRGITDAQVAEWIHQLNDVGLVHVYNDGSETYIHICGFELLQPKGRNGKRISKYPKPTDPGVSDGFLCHSAAWIHPESPQGESKTLDSPRDKSNGWDSPKGESERIRLIPESTTQSSAHNEHEHEHKHEQDKEQGHGQESPTQDSSSDAFDPIGEMIASGQSPGSGTPDAEPGNGREMGYVRWMAAVEPLIGFQDGRREPPASPKWNRDRVSAEAWFEERIWPAEIDDGQGGMRLKFALERAARASTESTNPMQYLAHHTKTIGGF